MPFGKHKGKTLPQIIFTDPSWVFWAYEKNIFKSRVLSREAEDICMKATSIKIPNQKRERKVAEYFIHAPTGKFAHMCIVPESQPQHVGSSRTARKDVIDLSFPGYYDKLGYKTMISD